ncbi:hypothetical protein KUCAC02_017634, partial [Chaenocephalus aceratus]
HDVCQVTLLLLLSLIFFLYSSSSLAITCSSWEWHRRLCGPSTLHLHPTFLLPLSPNLKPPLKSTPPLPLLESPSSCGPIGPPEKEHRLQGEREGGDRGDLPNAGG